MIHLELKEEEDENSLRTKESPWPWAGPCGPNREEACGGARVLETNQEHRRDRVRTGEPETYQEEIDAKTAAEEVWFWGKNLKWKTCKERETEARKLLKKVQFLAMQS